ncbi:MAG: anthrone oxygenase family protein [Actinomycetales bacterium]
MPPIVLGSIAAGLAVLAILHRPRSPLFVLTGISVALVLVTVVATIVGNWPLNDQTATWTLTRCPPTGQSATTRGRHGTPCGHSGRPAPPSPSPSPQSSPRPPARDPLPGRR